MNGCFATFCFSNLRMQNAVAVITTQGGMLAADEVFTLGKTKP